MNRYLRTDALISLKGKEGVLSPVGITNVYNFFSTQRAGNKYFLDGFDWSWMSKEGKLTKRLALKVYKDNGLQLSNEQLAELGNICSRGCNSSESLYIMVDNKFNWMKGDFSDGDSCLFQDDRMHAFDIFKHLGVYGMKVFLESAPDKVAIKPHWKTFYKHHPYGRCLLWPHPTLKDAVFVFNGYGGGRDTGYFAGILSEYLGWKHSKAATLSCNGMNQIYVNPGAILIAAEPIPTDKETVSFPKLPSGTKLVDLRISLCNSCQNILQGGERHVDMKSFHVRCVYNCPACGKRQAVREYEANGKKCINCGDEESECQICANVRRGKIKMYKSKSTPLARVTQIVVCQQCFDQQVTTCNECENVCLKVRGGPYCPTCEERL